jgi:glycosyltransferase involved in cell wall biosynthesis
MSSLTERTPTSPPIIAPVTDQAHRPLWSVMIPVYNCLGYLQKTLSSVLAQDPGPEIMQIAVIDDCSSDGDVWALVQQLGKGRVEYFRQEQNRGSLRNFETCLNRSRGHWVHLLHGDDWVAPGFYAEIARLFQDYPEAGAAFTHNVHFTVNMAGETELVERIPFAEKAGIAQNFLLRIAENQKLETPSIVVKRSVYEQLGSFFAVHYGEDWEMWARIAARFPIAYSPMRLSYYRTHHTSITQRSLETGQNVRDIMKVIDIIQGYLPIEQQKRLKKIARRYYALYCMYVAHRLYDAQPETNQAVAFIQAKGAVAMSKDVKVIYSALKLYYKHFTLYKQLKKL